jgi:hypothetical protein
VTKAQQADQLAASFTAIVNLHREEFRPATRPIAAPPIKYDAAAFLEKRRREAVQGISVFRRSERRAARALAADAARAELVALEETTARNQALAQVELDQAWARLLENDPEVVLQALSDAFEDNRAPAAPVGIDGPVVSVVTLVPDVSEVPEKRPDLTAAGNLTLKRLTKRDIADFYKVMVCGYVLATVKEVFAVAPSVGQVRIVALRLSPADAYGNKRVEAVLAAMFSRHRLDGVQWDVADAHTIVNDTSDELIAKQVGASKELGVIDVSSEPDLAALIDAVDIDELAP